MVLNGISSSEIFWLNICDSDVWFGLNFFPCTVLFLLENSKWLSNEEWSHTSNGKKVLNTYFAVEYAGAMLQDNEST